MIKEMPVSRQGRLAGVKEIYLNYLTKRRLKWLLLDKKF